MLILCGRTDHASAQADLRNRMLAEHETAERTGGAWSAAIDDLDQILETQPDNVRALLDRAESENALGCVDEARGNVIEVLTLDPGNTAAAGLEAALAVAPRAAPALEEPTGLKDEAWENYGLRALCAKHPEVAVQAFGRAISLGRRRADALNDRGSALITLRRYAEGIHDLDAALDKRPRYAAAHENRALAYLRSGDLDRAASDAEAAIAVLPRMTFAYGVRGDIRLAKHDTVGALADFQQEVRLRPDRANSHIDVGRAQEEAGDKVAAAKSYTEAIAADPRSARAWEFRASLRFGQGDHAAALPDYAKASQLAPDDAEILAQYGGSLRTERRYDEAVAVFDKAIAIKPFSYNARMGRGLTYEAVNLFKAELADLDVAVGSGRATADDYAKRGWTRWQAGHSEAEAEADYRHAIAMQPENADHHQNLGWYLFSTKRNADAIREFDDAIRLKPSLERAWRQRGMAWQALGDRVKAREDYAQAILLKPDYVWALLSRGLLDLPDKRLDEARTDLDAALRIDGLNAQVLLAHGLLELALHETAAAARDDVALSHRYPDREGLALLHADILLAGGALQLEQAELDHDIAVGRKAQPALLVTRALVRERLGDKEGALSDLTLAKDASSGAVEVLRVRERVLEELGRTGEARDELDLLRARSPDESNLYRRRALLDWRLKQIGQMVSDFAASL